MTLDAWALTTRQRDEVLKLIQRGKLEDRQKNHGRGGATKSSDENYIAWISTSAVPAATGTGPDSLTPGYLADVPIYRYNVNDGKMLAYTENDVAVTKTVYNYRLAPSPVSTFVHVHRDNFGQFYYDGAGAGGRMATVYTQITARSGTGSPYTAGTGKVEFFDVSGTTMTENTSTQYDVYNWTGVVFPVDRFVWVQQDDAGLWWVVSADCP